MKKILTKSVADPFINGCVNIERRIPIFSDHRDIRFGRWTAGACGRHRSTGSCYKHWNAGIGLQFALLESDLGTNVFIDILQGVTTLLITDVLDGVYSIRFERRAI